MAKNNGGPAYPVEVWETEHGDRVYAASGPRHSGMSLRDYFAGQALAGMLAHSRNGHGYLPRHPQQHWHDAISCEAYEIADAMLGRKTDGEE